MQKIAMLRREVRALLSRHGYPLSPFLLASLAEKYEESPIVVDTVVMVEHENRRKLPWMPWEVVFLERHRDWPDDVVGLILRRGVESVKGKRMSRKRKEVQGERHCYAD